MIKIEFNDSELQGLFAQARKLSDIKPVLQEMGFTNFNRFLEKQLQDRAVAVRFEQTNGLPLAEEQTNHGHKCP